MDKVCAIPICEYPTLYDARPKGDFFPVGKRHRTSTRTATTSAVVALATERLLSAAAGWRTPTAAALRRQSRSKATAADGASPRAGYTPCVPRVGVLLAAGLVVALVVAAVVVPVPGPVELRAWAAAAGAAAPLLLLVTYVVATLVPIPRTVFSLASGLLLGPVVGVTVALVATAVSALVSFALARRLGRRIAAKHLTRARVRAVDERLTEGGWLAVASLRIIPAIPFLPTNYACGLSAVRPWPYLAGTVAGSLPGTAAAVALGDTLTGGTPPLLLAVYALCAAAGAVGLWFALRQKRTVTST